MGTDKRIDSSRGHLGWRAPAPSGSEHAETDTSDHDSRTAVDSRYIEVRDEQASSCRRWGKRCNAARVVSVSSVKVF